MGSWGLLFDLVIFESGGDIIASDMDINNPWHALTKALLKLSPVGAYKFSSEDETLSDQVPVAVNSKYGNKGYRDCGVRQCLMTVKESLNYLIKSQSKNQRAWMTEPKEPLRCGGCWANV